MTLLEPYAAPTSDVAHPSGLLTSWNYAEWRRRRRSAPKAYGAYGVETEDSWIPFINDAGKIADFCFKAKEP